MEVNVAKSAGFCFGVKRAIDMVYSEIEKEGNIYTLGPIIHNEEVVNDLAGKGVKVVNSLEDVADIESGTIIIRSHGVGKDVYDFIEERGLNIVDATCPFVKKIHNIVFEESRKGNKVIIVGNENHPEVIGIKGWCTEDNPATVIETETEANNFSSDILKKEKDDLAINDDKKRENKICIVSQTTFNLQKFKEFVEIFAKKGYDINVVNTICNATEVRQTEAKELATESDAVIVIGGKTSSNTQKLYEICRRECRNTQYIQTLNDLDVGSLSEVKRVGITAGASTPNNIIEEVQNYVRINF